MLQAISALKSFSGDASAGRIGTVADFLFEDRKWNGRWLVVDYRTWPKGRKALIRPSVVSPYRFEEQQFTLKLTKPHVEESPELFEDTPVSSTKPQVAREL